jgi:hypothetical protein
MKPLLITSFLVGLSPAFGVDGTPATSKDTSFFDRVTGEVSRQRAAAAAPAADSQSTPPVNWPDPAKPRTPSVGSRLKGEFRVTAAGEGRAVLRPLPDDNAMRITAEFGAAEAVPPEGTQLTLTDATSFIVTRVEPSAAGRLNVFVRADTGAEIPPPLNLKWGESMEAMWRFLGNLRNISVTRRRESGEEVMQVEGAFPGIRRMLFGFHDAVLSRVVVLYEKPEKETESVDEKFRAVAENITKRYGNGERLTLAKEGEPEPLPIRWKKPHTELTMQFVKTQEGQETEAKLRIETAYAHTPAGAK